MIRAKIAVFCTGIASVIIVLCSAVRANEVQAPKRTISGSCVKELLREDRQLGRAASLRSQHQAFWDGYGTELALDPTSGKLAFDPASWGSAVPQIGSQKRHSQTDANRVEALSMDSLGEEIVVNDDTAGGRHFYPDVRRDSAGNFVVVWGDSRNGHYDIYAQRYTSAGVPLGVNFKVNDDTGPTNQRSPKVAMNRSGAFVVAWEDERNGGSDIYAQRYTSAGILLETNFRVNDHEPALQDFPDAAMDDSGNFVIAWLDYRNQGRADIYMQRYSPAGIAQGANSKVNDNPAPAFHRFVAISMNGAGNFVVAWEDMRRGNYDIYAQRFISAGTPIGTNFRVNDDAGSTTQFVPAISVGHTGAFLIAWEDKRNGGSNIYAQRYASTGVNIGTNFEVNDDSGYDYHGYPATAMDGASSFVISWSDYRNHLSDTYAQRFSSTGLPSDTNFKVNSSAGYASSTDPALALDDSGNFVITWQDYRNITPESFVQRYTSVGSAVDGNTKVNDDVGSANQENPAVAMDGSGGIVIAWDDHRNLSTSVYAQTYTPTGEPRGANSAVATFWSNESPAIATDSLGNFVITWSHFSGNRNDIYAQRYTPGGIPEDTSFKVNNNAEPSYPTNPAIAMDCTGSFVIIWDGNQDDSWRDIFGQRYTSAGVPVGGNFKVNDDAESAVQKHPSVAMDCSGNFVTTWQDGRSGGSEIYAQYYTSNGVPRGINFLVNDDVGSHLQEDPASAADKSGNFVITWEDNRTYYDYDIYAQMYDSAATPFGSNFKVNDDEAGAEQRSPAIAQDGSGNFLICWEDYRNGGADIYAQAYEPSGIPLRGNIGNFLVNTSQSASVLQRTPAVAGYGSKRFCISWVDNRRAKGWDIFARTIDLNESAVLEDQVSALPGVFVLSQNYPNPFNSETTIHFVLARPSQVQIDIFNALGQTVAKIVDKGLPLGSYQATWNGRDEKGNDLPSGVYFYRLNARGLSTTRKMVLLK